MKKLIACVLLGGALLALSACAKTEDGVITDAPAKVTHSAAPAVSSSPDVMGTAKPTVSP